MGAIQRAGCLVLNESKVLLVKDRSGRCWELPGGDMKRDETDEAVALAHTESMTGVKVRIIQLFGIYEYQKDGKDFVEQVFEADLPAESPIHENDDFEAKWFSLPDAKKADLCPETKLVFDDL